MQFVLLGEKRLKPYRSQRNGEETLVRPSSRLVPGRSKMSYVHFRFLLPESDGTGQRFVSGAAAPRIRSLYAKHNTNIVPGPFPERAAKKPAKCLLCSRIAGNINASAIEVQLSRGFRRFSSGLLPSKTHWCANASLFSSFVL